MKILVIGGTRYFGKKVVEKFLNSGDTVTILTRGQTKDDFKGNIKRIVSDRRDFEKLKLLTKNLFWDIILDQQCMNANDAKISNDVFFDKTNHYVMTSSVSVYNLGPNIKENKFDPYDFQFTQIANETENYQEAKRQAEATFAKAKKFPLTFIRPPIVLGMEDHSGRLEFHIKHVLENKPIYFPNIESHISFIHSEEAANSIFEVCKSSLALGPLNIASPKPVSLRNLMNLIEQSTSSIPKYHLNPDKHSWSPFGIESDWYVDVSKALSKGLKFSDTESWLPQLIEKMKEKIIKK